LSSKSQVKFKKNFKTYKTNHSVTSTLTVSIVDEIIHKLKRNKTPGQDGLTVEHIIFAHPLVIIIVTELLNLMLRFEHFQTSLG